MGRVKKPSNAFDWQRLHWQIRLDAKIAVDKIASEKQIERREVLDTILRKHLKLSKVPKSKS